MSVGSLDLDTVDPVPADLVARRFRGLSDDRRLAFLAALWDAEGAETTVADDAVVVDDVGDRRTVRVVEPSWFGDPADRIGDADVVVATEDDEGIAAAATAAGAAYQTPTDLRDRLLYAIDRERGTELCREYLNCEPVVPAAAGTSSVTGESEATDRADAESLVRRAAAPAGLLALVIALVVAGSGLPGPGTLSLGDGQSTATLPDESDPLRDEVDETSSSTATGTPTLPPGLSMLGVTDSGALARAHAQVIDDRAFHFELVFAGTPEEIGFQGFQYVHLNATVESYSEYLVTVTFDPGNASEPTTVISRYADGEREYVRRSDGSNVTYTIRDVIQGPQVTNNAASLIERYLETPKSELRRVETDDGSVYNVRAEGTPMDLDPNVRGYEAVATVRPNGFVQSLRVRYSRDSGGSQFPVRIGFHYEDVGTANATDPGWLDEARNRTATRTPTSTPTDG